MIFKNDRARFVCMVLLSAPLCVVAMDDPFNWNPHAEGPQYRNEVQQAIDAKRSSNASEDSDDHDAAESAWSSSDKKSAQGKAHANDAALRVSLIAHNAQPINNAGDDCGDIKANVTSTTKSIILEPETWAHAMRDDEQGLPRDIRALISEYATEWRSVKNMQRAGSCEGAATQRTVVSQGLYKGKDSIFVPFKQDEKPIYSAPGKGGEAWRLRIIDCQTQGWHEESLRVEEEGAWPVKSFPLSKGLLSLLNTGAIALQRGDIVNNCTSNNGQAVDVAMVSPNCIAVGFTNGSIDVWRQDLNGRMVQEHTWELSNAKKVKCEREILSLAVVPTRHSGARRTPWYACAAHNNNDDPQLIIAFCARIRTSPQHAWRYFVNVWNADTHECITMNPYASKTPLAQLIAMPDGRAIVARNDQNELGAWDMDTRTLLASVRVRRQNVLSMTPISHDEIAILSEDRDPISHRIIPYVRIFNIRTGGSTNASEVYGVSDRDTLDTIIGLQGCKMVARIKNKPSTMVCAYEDHYGDALKKAEQDLDCVRNAGIFAQLCRAITSRLAKTKKDERSKKRLQRLLCPPKPPSA